VRAGSKTARNYLFKLEPVGDRANVGVEEVGPVHVEQTLELVHPNLRRVK
jgi:hypothetical protein